MLNKIIFLIKNPQIILDILYFNYCPDKMYLSRLFYKKIGYKINWDSPKTFNEKLNWLKINDKNSLYTKLADKYKVKDYVAKKIGVEYVVKNYGVWDSADDIDISQLPDSFVFKTTHDSGGVIICKDKASFLLKEAIEKLKSELHSKHYKFNREWVYKNIKPRIIADMFLDDQSGHELTDYKFWCFNGVPKLMYITNKGSVIYENFYDMEFKPVAINHGFSRKKPEYTKPENFELMKELAGTLSEGIPFVRVDFFNVNHRVYFGEFTFYDWGAMRAFESYEMDLKLGNLIRLPR